VSSVYVEFVNGTWFVIGHWAATSTPK
jgi:hypothetical protein